MKATERRKMIAAMLLSEKNALSGDELSKRLSVSRQTIVQDISVLKSEGYEIFSTHCGYVIHSSPLAERVFEVSHTSDYTEDELLAIVDQGGSVVDVFVWHKIYGKISATLNIFSRHGVQKFMEEVRSGRSMELMSVTGGHHFHTVRADSEETLDRIEKSLTEKNYIVSKK